MGRPTKKEQAAKKKAEAAAKAKENSAAELAKKQEELNRKAEERNKKKIADAEAEKSKSAESSIENKGNSNEIPEQTHVEENQSQNIETVNQEVNSSADANSNEVEVNNPVVEENNDIPDITDEMDIPEEIQIELDNASNPKDYSIPDDEFDPLKEKVIKRSYTDGSLGSNKEQPVSIDNMQQNTSGDSSDNSQTEGGGQTTQNTAPPVIEEVISEPEIKTTPQEINMEGDTKDSTTSATKTEKPKVEPVNPKLEDLSPSQKRKAAEKTADALLTTYKNLVPIPFIKMSSFNMRKLEQRHMNDEIDMHMAIMDDGTKIKDYCEGVNAQAEATFVITKEMQDEIREPLIDVLLENNFALTPTQRLIMAVGGQVVQMGITAIQFMQQNSAAMETFKKFHEENKALKAEVKKATSESNFSEKVTVNNENNNTSNTDDVRNYSKNPSSDIPTSEEEASTEEKITVEEFLNDGK